MIFNISELFVLNDIVENVLKTSKIKLNFFEKNSISEKELKINMSLN